LIEVYVCVRTPHQAHQLPTLLPLSDVGQLQLLTPAVDPTPLSQVWENWSPEDEAAGAEDEEANGGEPGSSSGGGADMRVVVTEVTDNGEFYVQSVEEPRVAWIAEQLKGVTITDGPVFQVRGWWAALCLAHHTLSTALLPASITCSSCLGRRRHQAHTLVCCLHPLSTAPAALHVCRTPYLITCHHRQPLRPDPHPAACPRRTRRTWPRARCAWASTAWTSSGTGPTLRRCPGTSPATRSSSWTLATGRSWPARG
jgi:hypothetical protein